jgi:HAD superfamily hydrolase (TIGR01549 family)
MAINQIISSVLFSLGIFSLYIYIRRKNAITKYPPGTKMLIFDFDGTIIDSLPVLLESLNNNAARFGYEKVQNPESIRSQDLRTIIKKSNISPFKLFSIIYTIRREMRSKIASLKPFPGILPVLTQLHAQGVLLGIVTSNTKENVEPFLTQYTINFFDIIEDKSSLFGKAKVLKHLLTTYGLGPANIIYIGDETRDIEAAQANHIRSAAVTWGFNTADILQTKNPTYLIHTPSELLWLAEKL